MTNEEIEKVAREVMDKLAGYMSGSVLPADVDEGVQAVAASLRAFASRLYDKTAKVASDTAATHVAAGMWADPSYATELATRHGEARVIERRILALKDSLTSEPVSS
jgi:hypothetical protein